MIAVIMLPGPFESRLGLDERHPAALLPLGDRPILQHIVEQLRDRGVRRFEFILGQSPEKVEGYFGDGTRWGCSFRWHLSRQADAAYRLLPVVAEDPRQIYFLAEASRFPCLGLGALCLSGNPVVLTVRECESAADEVAASIWSPRALDVGRAAAGRNAFLDYLDVLRHTGAARWIRTAEFIDARDALRLLSSQYRLFDRFPQTPATAKEPRGDGIRIARNVVIHPSATLTAPVYIGPNSRIGRHVQLGPNAVVGADCVVDHQSALRNSLILQGTYVGQKLDLADVIADRDLLVNARLSASLPVSDSFILCALLNKVQRGLGRRGISAILASVLLLALLPLFVGTLIVLSLSRRGALISEEVLCLPAGPHRRRTFPILLFHSNKPAPTTGPWRYLLFRFIPGLLAIVRGDCSFVGLPPRTPAEVEQLSPDWQSSYLDGKPGLISEALVRLPAPADPTDLYLSDAFYNATQTTYGDLKLLARFAAQLAMKLIP